MVKQGATTVTQPAEAEALVTAAVVATEAEDAELPREITLSNGVVLGLKSVPLFLVRAVGSKLTPPKAPKIHLDDRDADVDNYDDPDYLDAMTAHGNTVFDTTANLLLLAGTTLKHVPENVPGPASEEWLGVLKFFCVDAGLDLDDERQRYLAWLRYYALESPEDIANVTDTVSRLSGITEGAVQQAISSFRGRKIRRSDNGVSFEGSGDGDSVQEGVARDSE